MSEYRINIRCCVVLLCISWYHCCQAVPVEYVNVALGKPTQQRDVSYQGFSELAVDGNRQSRYTRGSCTHTKVANKTYWFVDLKRTFPIYLINITNRNLIPDRLTDFYIYVSNVNPLPIPRQDGTYPGELCLHHAGTLPAGGPHSVQCQHKIVYGRYVYVWKPKYDQLTFCEFEVFVDRRLVDGQKRYFVLPGRKIQRSPYFWTIMQQFSRMDCVRTCLSTQGGYLIVVQVETETKRCECIEESGLEGSDADIADDGWTLMKPLMLTTLL